MTDTALRPKIVLPGGSGLLGSLLAPHLAGQGFQVAILSRKPRPNSSTSPNIRTVAWNPRALDSEGEEWTRELESAHAVINLAGRSVDCRYTRKNRREIVDSRILPTRLLGKAIARCDSPPKVWLNASTATIYRHSLDRPMDELAGTIAATDYAKDAFSIEVATRWEQALEEAPTPHTRKVALRTAMVLAPAKNSVYPVLRRLVRLGLGGTIGPGNQYLSWIHHADFCRAIDFLLARADLSGPVNLTAPNPLPNREFMQIFRESCCCRIGVPTPRPLLELGCLLLRTESELLIKSRHVLPTRLTNAGFQFRFPALSDALADLDRAPLPSVVPDSTPATRHESGRRRKVRNILIGVPLRKNPRT